jgi:hypothetical protein
MAVLVESCTKLKMCAIVWFLAAEGDKPVNVSSQIKAIYNDVFIWKSYLQVNELNASLCDQVKHTVSSLLTELWEQKI